MKHTKDDLKPFFEEMDNEFETLENVIRNALEIIDVYEKQVESSGQK
ncbi:MAG: hypothetical protein KGZ34_06480 [Nitrosarchaeum sp.]|nr:hypothetical protein [Nitrosarchaeum sp.]